MDIITVGNNLPTKKIEDFDKDSCLVAGKKWYQVTSDRAIDKLGI